MKRRREFPSRKMLSVFLLSILYLILLSPVQSVAQVERDDLTGVKVAVYNGLGVMGSSRIALTRMFEWMNATVVDITASQILEDFLDDYDILVIPGGSESTCSSELESEGRQKVKDFVANGGSYFGICGGATFGATYLHLINCFLSPVNEPGNLIHMTTMNLNQSSTGPALSDFPANFSTMYYASQYFTPQYGTTIHKIASFDYNDKAGMIAGKYGNGTVFLSSPHPEYEEDNDRDDTTFGDDLEDPESEWDLLLRVSIWLIEASYVEPVSSETTPTPTPTESATTPDLPMIAVGSTGGVIILLTIVILYRRVH